MPRGDKAGSVFPLPDGRWVARKRYVNLKKRPRQKKRVADSEAKAYRLLVKIEQEIADELAGRSAANRTEKIKTFKDAAEWCKLNVFKAPIYSGLTKVSGLRSWKSVHGYLAPLNKYFGSLPFVAIDYDDLTGYIEWRLTQKHQRSPEGEHRQVSMTTIDRELAYLKRICKIGRRRNWRKNNPFDEGDPLIKVSVENKVARILSSDEEPRLFAAFNAPKRKHLAFETEMALETAMRQGEQFSLKISDVDLDSRLITVTSYKGRVARKRLVPITDTLYPKLAAHIEERRFEVRALIREDWIQRRRDYLFRYASPSQGFEQACKDAQIAGFTWHCLRHTAVTRMVHVYKMDPHAVMEISGHDSWKTFWQTYVNVDRELAQSFGRQLSAARAALQAPPRTSEPDTIETDAVN